MEEKLFLFNPFNIKNISEKELASMYQEVFKKIVYAHNIEVYSNLNYLIGEVIARLTKDIIELKTQIEIDRAIKTTEERKNWNTERDGKAPAMAYFEALGTRFCKDSINRLADKECSLKRFKNAYTSTENKINALKKKLESIKYENSFEEFNN